MDFLSEFKKITQKDIANFLRRAQDFLHNDRPLIVEYYTGKSKSASLEVFQRFDTLEKELKSFFDVYQLHSQVFVRSYWWNLLDILEQLDNVFSSLRNIHRWSRSSISKFGYDPNIQIYHTLTENQTLERVAKDMLLQSDFNDSWRDIAVSNDLTEEEYTSEGGIEILLNVAQNNRSLQKDSVVDVMIGKKIYGIDLDRKLTFINNSNGFDIKTLSYDETIKQAVDILILLKKNSNPDFPYDGLQSSVVVGSNRALLNFPVIVRQLKQTFDTDDTLRNFAVQNINYEQDNFFVSYEVETCLSEAFEDTRNI